MPPLPEPTAVPSASEFEKLGVFYLGRGFDPETGRRRPSLMLYDSKDLVTHAVCVGMTGSGKTGLCIALLEEAAIDGVPAIVIDPKGDLSNLLLTFPELRPADFRPWINDEDARAKGVTPDEFAAQQAAAWAAGLSEWGQDGARITAIRRAADFTIYTPGSSAGVPVSVLRSFDPPGQEVLDDAEAFGERVSGTATSLLGLIGIEADPTGSREHILISTILADAWSKGKSLDLASLIQLIQSPPVQRVGVMDIETFFPGKERFALAMAMNNLAAAPGFGRWLEGEPLDIASMLRTSEGRPRVSIFSIGHLSEPERMFFVSLLLNQTLGWVRSQSGTSSLRGLLYMDEIAGYFPPVANPPSKGPLLTLMKQGRAFGFGVVLATQNPVDLDYKGLSNAGTWFIGRLQTERDKARVLDGLEGAAAGSAAGFDRASMDRMISGLRGRTFLMNNVHDDGPTVFESRWAMSYLRGPLTKQQIKMLMDPKRAEKAAPEGAPGAEARVGSAAAAPGAAPGARAVLPPDVPQYFIPLRKAAAGTEVVYAPMLLGCGKVYYKDAAAGIDTEAPASLLAAVEVGPVAVDWDRAAFADIADGDLDHEPAAGAGFAAVPAAAGKVKSYAEWKKGFADALFRRHTLELLRSGEEGESSRPGESERDFRARLALAAREVRDGAMAGLRAKYAPKSAVLDERVRRAEQAVEAQRQQSHSAMLGTALSVGSAIFGAFIGRKAMSAANISKAATAARGVGRSVKESGDVGRAEETVEALRRQRAKLEEEFKAEAESLRAQNDPATEKLEKVSLRPKKTNITVRAVVLAWAPRDAGGNDLWV